MTLKNYVTPHCHPQSLDSASTPEAFIRREKELGTGHITVTDHGSLAAAQKIYSLAKKENMTPIIGLEAYFRDDNCPILTAAGVQKTNIYVASDGTKISEKKFESLKLSERQNYQKTQTFADYAKYFHLTMHFQDQSAYETGVKLLSKADSRAEKHGQERKPLFDWNDLEELGAQNVTFTSSCLVGMVQRHLVNGSSPKNAFAYLDRLKSIVKPGNFYVEVFPHKCTHYYQSIVLIQLEGDKEPMRLPVWKNIKTEAGECTAEELTKKMSTKAWLDKGGVKILAIMDNRKWVEREPKIILSAIHQEGFVQNECKPWASDGDLQHGCNKFVLLAAQKYNLPVLISDDSHFAYPEEKTVQDIRLQAGGGNWRFHNSYHRQSAEESAKHFREMGVSESQIEEWVNNSYEWASKFKDFNLKYEVSLPTKFYPSDTLRHTMALIKKHGRMDWNNQEYVQRLKSEIDLLHKNGKVDLLPYFFMGEEVCAVYEEKGLLTGPGRGSAAGLLLTYLLGITHVDPLKFGLSKDRFLTLDRIKSGKLPDIDQDLPQRDLLVEPEKGWLHTRFGDHFAQISVDTTLKLRSSVKDVARVKNNKHVPKEIEELTKKFENAPQGVSDSDFLFGYDNNGEWVEGSIERDLAVQEYIKKYPKEWEIVKGCLGLPRQKGRHASAYVVANKPISDFIPLTSVSGVTVTQYTAPSVESAGGLKMDFLVINVLNDISDTIKLIQKRQNKIQTDSVVLNGKRVPSHRLIPHNGELFDVWALPEDTNVFDDICSGRTETVFQFNTSGATQWLREFNKMRPDGKGKLLNSIEDLAAFTALDRPGPLDARIQADDGTEHNMLVEFARRAAGKSPSGDSMPILQELLPETHGVIVYQEQLTKIYQEIGGTTGAEADEFRVHISKKQMEKVMKDKGVFMRGATTRLSEVDAEKLWGMMETFAQYGFNKSHAICYVTVGYACAWLKHHYPLEWWVSVLSNADKNEVNEVFWKYCGHLIDMPDVNLSGKNFQIVDGRIRAPISLLHGVGEKAHEQLCKYAPYKDIEDFCQKIKQHKIENGGKVLVPKKVKMKKGDTQIGDKVIMQEQFREGRSSLTHSTINSLIVTGAMDSLFSPEMSVVDKLVAYAKTMMRVEGESQTKIDAVKIDSTFSSLGPLGRFQFRKKLLPAYSCNLSKTMLEMGVDGVFQITPKRLGWAWNKKKYAFASAQEIDTLEKIKLPPQEESIKVAVAAFVESDRRFNYGPNKEKSACELVLDVGGSRIKTVKWPKKSGELPSHWHSDYSGAIVVALLNIQNEKSFILEDVIQIQSPLPKKE